MAYGILKCDTITFTDAGVDKSVTISGLVQNPTFSGNITVTGTVSGNTMRGQTVSGATITGGAAAFTTVTGGVVTITSGVFALGSASNPSISFSGDANSGLYSPGADQVAISTNGTGRLFVDASGNVGIGATPNTTFELTTLNDTANSNPATLRFRDTDTSQQLGQIAGRIQFYSSDNTGPIGVYGEIRGLADGVNGTGAVVIATGTAGSAIEHFRVSNGGATSLTSDSGTSPLVVNISSTEVARIDSSGRLLVGTSSASTTSTTVFQGNSGGATSHAIANLQRGATNPGTNLSLGFVQFADSVGSVGAQVYAQTDAAWASGSYPGRLVFSTTADGASSPTERMRISSSGNVGIGTTTVDSLLHVSEPTNTSVDLLLVARGGNSLSSEVRFLTKNSGGTNVGGAIGYGTSGLTLTASATTIDTAQNVVIDTSGRLLVGTSSTSADTLFRVQGKQSSSASNGVIQIARGQTNPASGNGLGWVDFTDAAGSVGASIRAETELNWGASDYPSRLVFSTTADGASSPTERLRITNDGVKAYDQTAPAAVNATATLTVANLKTGIITSTSALATDMTLPTGTDTQAGFSGTYDNFTFEWSVINTGPSLVRVLAGTAHTIVGSGSVATGTSGRFASRRTAANTFVTYRLS